MLARQRVRSGGLDRPILPGDNLALSLLPVTVNSATGVTLTVEQILAGYIKRTGAPAGGITDTMPTADQIVDALDNAQGGGIASLQGMSIEFLYNNGLGQVLTMAVPANSGMTIGTSFSAVSTVAASKVRSYLLRFLCDPVRSSIQTANGVNGTAVLTFASEIPAGSIVTGMSVYGTNIAASATIIGITNGTDGIAGVTLSGNNTGTITNGSITFCPSIELLSQGAMDV